MIIMIIEWVFKSRQSNQNNLSIITLLDAWHLNTLIKKRFMQVWKPIKMGVIQFEKDEVTIHS